jgi:hypothetical protein
MNKNYPLVRKMKKILAFLLAAILMVMACMAPAFADEDDGDDADENEAGESSSNDDEKENSVPGFEFALGGGALIAVARFFQARLA